MSNLLITGASRGIGLEFVKQYSAAGWRVLACCRTPAEAEALHQVELASAGRVTIHELDVANFPAVDDLANELHDIPIDLIINNAGIYPDRHTGFGHTDFVAWAEAFHVNAMAPLKVAEAFISNLECGKGKTIATISSKMGSVTDNTSGGAYLYRSSKAAVNIVVKSLSLDLADRGIHAVVLHPGWVLTDMGGPNALITVEQSVSGMRNVLAELKAEDTGKFLGYDGKEVPW
jgi:NAD(P)-dependent dehydrogenase (short-subunit alcohol dehydrogenase family)